VQQLHLAYTNMKIQMKKERENASSVLLFIEYVSFQCKFYCQYTNCTFVIPSQQVKLGTFNWKYMRKRGNQHAMQELALITFTHKILHAFRGTWDKFASWMVLSTFLVSKNCLFFKIFFTQEKWVGCLCCSNSEFLKLIFHHILFFLN
jgi:hypothetical protein